VQSSKIRVLQFKPGFWFYDDSAGRINHLVDVYGVSLERDCHTPPGEVTDVVLVDIVLTTRTFDELDIGGVQMEFEELSE
jgi:hypothetical protein